MKQIFRNSMVDRFIFV